MADTTRNINDEVSTIPAGVDITGTLTTDTNEDTVLQYSGTTNLQDFLDNNNNPVGLNGGNTGLNGGYTYLYLAGKSPYIFKISGINYISESGSTFNYAITVDKAASGVSVSSFQIIFGNLTGYSYSNDGGADGTIDGVTIPDGVANNFLPYEYTPVGKLKTPVVCDATGTNFLVVETLSLNRLLRFVS